jgi:hypothetical protein
MRTIYKHAYYDGTYALRDGLKPVKREGYFTDLINERAVKFIRDHQSQAVLLYVPHLAVHSPFPAARRARNADGDQGAMHHGSRAIYKPWSSASTSVSA